MKTWNRWIGYCAVASTLSLSSTAVQAQQGYNTSGTRPGQGKPATQQAGSPQPNATQSGGVPSGTNTQGTLPVSRSTLDLQANPALQESAAPAAVTRDPYADRPLSQQEIVYLDRLLDVWEQNTKKIDRLSCDFIRYEYNSNANFVRDLAQQTNTDIRNIPTTKSAGALRFMKPDKGMYQIKQMVSLTGKLDAKNRPEMLTAENANLDHWICDGATVHNYDHVKKLVTHYTIPPEMQGVGILESPMPFVLGVEAKKMKERYWLRPLPSPPNANGTPNEDIFVIEAYPKTQQDAVNYSHVVVYLDRSEFLPVALTKYNPEHNDVQGADWVDSREHYEFPEKGRAKNETLFTKISEGIFRNAFIPLKVDAGWTEETRAYIPPGMENPNMDELMQPQSPNAQFGGTPNSGGTANTQGTQTPASQPTRPAATPPVSASRPVENGLRTR